MSRTTTLHLLADDYAERLDDLKERADAVERRIRVAKAAEERGASSRRMGQASESARLHAEYDRLAAEFEELKTEAETAAVTVTVRALTRGQWKALKRDHPPRSSGEAPDDEVQKDAALGVNVDEVEEDLLHRAMVEPMFSSRAAFDEWVDGLDEAMFEAAVSAAWSLARVARVNPKSLPALPTPTPEQK